MIIKVWSSGSDSCKNFIELAEVLVKLELYDSIELLSAALKDKDVIFLDYDQDPKKVDKAIREIKQLDKDVCIMLAANSLSAKQLVKHQKGKYSADLYIKTPMSSAFFEAVLSSHFNYKSATSSKVVNIMQSKGSEAKELVLHNVSDADEYTVDDLSGDGTDLEIASEIEIDSLSDQAQEASYN